MMSVLSNGLRSTYNKRDVDARLRVLNEKEIALQTTNPATFLVIGIHVVAGKAGSKYTVGQKVTIGPNNAEIEAKVTSVDSGGGITGLWFDDTKAYSVNLETINPGTVEADENDVFDDAHDPHAPVSVKPRSYSVYPKPVNGTFAEVRVVTRYAPGDYPSYGTLGHATVHDPLVQASYMTGYVEKKLEDAVVMTFVGYVSKHDPRWPWSATVVGKDEPVNPNKPVEAVKGVVPRVGDLWYASDVTTSSAPVSGTGDITPESALPDTNFPWGTKGTPTVNLFCWEGFKWLPLSQFPATSKHRGGYTPERFDTWETLNVTDAQHTGASGQNTGFYWLDQWKLYTFSVDETAFVHLKGNETVNGQKAFGTHLVVPATNNAAKIDTSSDADRTRYATIAQVTESVLLLSGSNRGATQTVNGATTFASDITLPVKNTAAAQNVTTHPASEHQVYLASQAGTTALNTHKTAATIDHPDLSVTTAKLAASAVTTAKITDKNVTVGKVQDITADDNSVKPTFSATAVTFQAFLQTVWQGITWLVYKMNASSGHKHTGGTDDAPQIGTSGIADSAVTSAKIADGTIVNADISATAAIATSKISGVSSSLTDGKFLKDTGTWVVPPDTVYTYPTTTGYKHIPSGGSSGQFLKWSSDGTATWAADNDTVYTHPAYTANASGLYKITVDSLGHVSATTAVSKADITGLGIPASDTNTTYAEMTGTTLGLVKLNGSYTFTGTINVPTPALPS